MFRLPLPSVCDVYEHRVKVLAVVAAGMLALALRQHERIGVLEAAIAAKPAIESKEAARVERKEERGPKVVTRRYAPPPAPTPACPVPAPVLIEERVEEGPVVSYEMLEKTVERSEKPVGLPPPRRRTRYLGLEYEPIGRRVAGRAAFDMGPVEASFRHEFPPKGFAPWFGVGYRF